MGLFTCESEIVHLKHQISQYNIWQDAGTKCYAVEEVDPYSSHEDIERPRADQEKKVANNTRKEDVREGAIGGSWKKTIYEDFDV